MRSGATSSIHPGLRRSSFSHSIGVCDTTFSNACATHVVLMRRDVEIADQDMAVVTTRM